MGKFYTVVYRVKVSSVRVSVAAVRDRICWRLRSRNAHVLHTQGLGSGLDASLRHKSAYSAKPWRRSVNLVAYSRCETRVPLVSRAKQFRLL